MPGLVERAGNGREGQGSITAFYTVLTEGDDLQDPIADAARGILDGNIEKVAFDIRESHHSAENTLDLLQPIHNAKVVYCEVTNNYSALHDCATATFPCYLVYKLHHAIASHTRA